MEHFAFHVEDRKQALAIQTNCGRPYCRPNGKYTFILNRSYKRISI